jgi:predicted small lipoprotein YifL
LADLVWCRPKGSIFVTSAHIRLASLVLALGLTGCGVAGPLEPPPDSGIHPNAPQAHSANVPVIPGTLAARTGSQSVSVRNIARGTTSQAVVNAPAAEKKSPLDWLID